MAKVSEIKFELNGVPYKVNVNCNSSGQFNANIPEEVAEALRTKSKLTANTLADLTQVFNDNLERYKELHTDETLHILIAYQARGKYSYRADGSVLFSHNNNNFHIESSFAKFDNALGIDFFVAIKETIDGKEKWFRAVLGKDFPHFESHKEYHSKPDMYFKRDSISEFKIERYKVIPFDEISLDTLKRAEEKLRTLSEMLFDFINQDEEQISLALNNNKLLN